MSLAGYSQALREEVIRKPVYEIALLRRYRLGKKSVYLENEQGLLLEDAVSAGIVAIEQEMIRLAVQQRHQQLSISLRARFFP